MCLLHSKGQSLRYSPGWGNPRRCIVVLYVGRRGLRGNNAAGSAGSQSLPLLPTSKLGPSGVDSQVGGFVYILGRHEPLQWTLLWGWEFLPLLQPSKVFTVKGFEALFPALEPWVAWSVSLPSCSSWFICTQMQDHPVLQLLPCCESSPTCCLSLPLLQVWMDVSSLTTWLSDFHTGWFSGSSCCFLFLNLLSFFWLCKEAKCVYLHLHVGQKSTLLYSFDFSHITLKFSLFKHILSSCFKVLAC